MSDVQQQAAAGAAAENRDGEVDHHLTVVLKTELERYAALHAQTYGEPIEVATLIPHMLEAFMARDRGFRKSFAKGAPASRPIPESNP